MWRLNLPGSAYVVVDGPAAVLKVLTASWPLTSACGGEISCPHLQV